MSVTVATTTRKAVVNGGNSVAVTTAQIKTATAGTQGAEGKPVIAGGNLDFKTVANDTYVLQASARYAFTIDGLYGLKTSAGTVDVTVAINGTPVTGINAISASASVQDVVASAANSVAVGDRVTLVLANNSSAADLEFTLDATAT